MDSSHRSPTLPRISGRGWRWWLCFIQIGASVGACAAALVTADPDNYRERLARLEPGDTLVLAAGIYRAGLPVHRLNGAAGRPIVIAGPAHGAPALFEARAGYNTISLVDSSYVTIRRLELDGRGLAVDGVKAEGGAAWTHHITLENLVIRGHGHDQQTVGISTKAPAWDWIIRDNVIMGAGTGIYLGDSDGSAPFVGGVIEGNLVADTIGYNLQVKHQAARPDRPGMPAERRATVIRYNLFSKARGASGRPMARPNVLVGHWPLAGAGSADVYLIYGNLFYENPHEALFQGEGNVALYNNLFVNHYGDAVRVQPHNDLPRAISVFFNTVVAAARGIVVVGGAPQHPQIVAANAVFAPGPIAGGIQVANVTAPLEEAEEFLADPFAPLGEMDLYPRRGGLRIGTFDTAGFRAFLDWDQDYNGRRRAAAYAGAYGGEGANPGRMPRLTRRGHTYAVE